MVGHLLRRQSGPFPQLRTLKGQSPLAGGPLASLPEFQEMVVFM